MRWRRAAYRRKQKLSKARGLNKFSRRESLIWASGWNLSSGAAATLLRNRSRSSSAQWNGMEPIRCTSRSRPGQMEGLNFLNEATYRYPGAVSFVAGRPADRLVSVRACYSWLSEFSKYRRARSKTKNGAFWHELGQYSATAGIICEILAKHLECDEGLKVSANSIVVTNGCQEAMFLTLLALFDRDGDVLLVQDPAYFGITGSAAIAGVSIWPIPEVKELSDFLDFAVDR